MLAFARYAGMRSHETKLPRWCDIDIPNRRMIVRSNKTPPERVCPIFPELLPHLIRAKEMADAGAELDVSPYPADANPVTTLKKIIKRAGLSVWPKPLQNLRATRETELMARFPIKVELLEIGRILDAQAREQVLVTARALHRRVY